MMTKTAITCNAGRASQRLAPRAFTLLEVSVAMSIGLIVLGVSVLSISGVQDENRICAGFDPRAGSGGAT